MSDVVVLMQFGLTELTLKLSILLFVSATTGLALKTCDTTKGLMSFHEPFSGSMVPCPESIINCPFVGGTEAQTNCNLCCVKRRRSKNKTQKIKGRPRSTKSTTTNPVLMTSASPTGWSKLTKNFSMATTNSVLMTSSVLTTRATQSGGNSVILVFVTPTALLPTANKPKTKTCELVAGTKEPGYLQSFTGDIERCPKNISDCALVGDAETQQSCRTCCAVNITIAGRPRSTKSTLTNPVLMTSASPTGWSKLTKNFSMAVTSSVLITSSVLTTRATQSGGNSAIVTPTMSTPITKCGIIPGTKKQGFPQSFADALQACPKNILDCVAVGDAEAQRNCETCCTRSPAKTRTIEVTKINYTQTTPTQTMKQHSVFATSPTSTTSNKTKETRCGHIPDTNIPAFYQPFVENIEPCPKVTSNCRTVGDEETRKNCLECCTANSGSDQRNEKSNHVKTILSGVFGTIGCGLVFVILGVLVKKRWETRVNILSTQTGRKPLASENNAESPAENNAVDNQVSVRFC